MNTHVPTVKSTVAGLSMLFCSVAAVSHAGGLPSVGSGSLVAHFQAGPNVEVDVDGTVNSWTAENDNAIVLTTIVHEGVNTITYDAAGMNGNPTVVVNDPADNKASLQGGIGLTADLTSATIFWLGYFSPGREFSGGVSLGDGSGQYAYSLGADGADGSQMDNQIDDGNFEYFGGSGTQTGDPIAALNGQYTVWRSEYYDNVTTDPGHIGYANNTNLNVAANGAGYSVPTGSELVLFAYQDSGGNGDSGFNFVGNMSELIIYEGNLDPADVEAVESYLRGRIPEPSSAALLLMGMLGIAQMGSRRG